MRWKLRAGPREGERFEEVRFAWLPQQAADGHVYWLERVRISGVWERMWDVTSGGGAWLEKRVTSVVPVRREVCERDGCL